MNIEGFKNYLSIERRLSSNTVESYLSDLRAWLEAGFLPDSLPSTRIESLKTALRKFSEKDLESSTLLRRASSLRAFSRFLSLTDSSWEKLFEELPQGSLPEFFPSALDIEEIEEFLDFDPGQDALLIRNKSIFELLFASGLRVSELLNLSWQQVDERQGILRIMGKGNKERLVPYSERAGKWLFLYRDLVWQHWSEHLERRFQGRIFLNKDKKGLSRMGLWKIVQKRALQMGLDKRMHPHVFRHSFATHLLRSGVDLRAVQLLLGHASVATTERYLKITDEELHEVFKIYHPWSS